MKKNKNNFYLIEVNNISSKVIEYHKLIDSRIQFMTKEEQFERIISKIAIDFF